MRSGGDAALSRSLRDAVLERDLDRDSRLRFLLLSRDLERFLTRSFSRERLRFLLCLPLLACLERDELRLRDRPISPHAGCKVWKARAARPLDDYVTRGLDTHING